MRAMLFAGMLVLAACAGAPAERSGESLTAFADAFDAAQISQDRPALERMISEDLVYIDGAGRRLGKAAFIDGWTGPNDRYDPVTLIDRVILPLGTDAGVVNAETVLSGVSNGERFAVRLRFADTFRRMDGEWRAVHIQVTRMPG